MIVLDRRVDMITPLLTQLTYEGLLGHFSKTGIDERAAKFKHHYHRLTGKTLAEDAFVQKQPSIGMAET